MSARSMHSESGFTLIELLLTCVLMIVVLGATLTTLSSFQSNAAKNDRQNDAQDEARRAIDTLARELRNLASPVDYDPKAVKKFEDDDLVVQSVAQTRPPGSENARNTQYVRYCHDAATRRIYRQLLTWTTLDAPEVPASTSCPQTGGAWGSTQVVAANVVNDAETPIFTYNGVTAETITEIHTALQIDTDLGALPRATTIATTVFLRNQNRVPIARFSADPAANGAILLNGAASEDPEERELRYFWYDDEVDPNVARGTGIVFVYTPPEPGQRSIRLVVMDPADLIGEAEDDVCVPGLEVTC